MFPNFLPLSWTCACPQHFYTPKEYIQASTQQFVIHAALYVTSRLAKSAHTLRTSVVPVPACFAVLESLVDLSKSQDGAFSQKVLLQVFMCPTAHFNSSRHTFK